MSDSKQIDDGGPAFPGPSQAETSVNIHEGMTLRDWFAGQALAAVLTDGGYFTEVAKDSYLIADAMMKARHEQ